MFGPLLVGAGPHPAHARSRANAFSRGLPEHGAEFADDLERVIALHDASTIAAVIVEPVAGSTGVLVPPKGCLERIRAIRDRQGVLLVFDEVITGFGRLGPPFAADFFGVTPDLMALAKGITSGVIPMGAVLVRKEIYDALMQGPEHLIELLTVTHIRAIRLLARPRWAPSTPTATRIFSHMPTASPVTGKTRSIRSRGRLMSSTCVILA
jgi:beta-alanine--pyruvate transaminase